MLGTNKAPYACDSCRERKIGCSRERPKCENCKRWPGECIYSARGRRSGIKKPAPGGPGDTSLEARVQSLENLVQSLHTQVQQLTTLIPQKYGSGLFLERFNKTDPAAQATGTPGSQSTSATPGRLATPSSILDRAGEELQDLELHSQGSFDFKDATTSLRDLSRAFTTGDSAEIHGQLDFKLRRQNTDEFYIPTPQDAVRLTEMFLNSIEVGKPMFTRPPADVINRLALEPWTIADRGWVLLFNCMISTAILLEEPSNLVLSEGLRWNTRLAMDDASLFLEPSLAKVQAFLALATHSFDFATPSMTCILISQACQMAKLLGLDHPFSDEQERGIPAACAQSLFWSLYILDKEMSLAFGRSPFLLEESLIDVPRPDSSALADFNPHLPKFSNSPEDSLRTGGQAHEVFGASYFKAIFEFSLFISKACRIHSRHGKTDSSPPPDVMQLISELKIWKQTNIDHLRAINLKNRESDDSGAKQETRLAIEYLKFRYHHLLVILTRSTDATRLICLTSARKAITLLDSLVSSSQRVYNGVIWILLYYPFVPFFSLFGNIITYPSSEECARDLELLRATVSFYRLMDQNHPHSNKLCKIAGTFTHIAEKHVIKVKEAAYLDQRSRSPVPISMPTSGQNIKGIIQSLAPKPVNPTAEISSTPSPILHTSTDMKMIGSSTTAETRRSSSSSQSPSHAQMPGTTSAWRNPEKESLMNTEEQSLDWPGLSAMDVDEYMQFFEPNAANAPLDCNFDWFSWDAYESAQSHEDQMRY